LTEGWVVLQVKSIARAMRTGCSSESAAADMRLLQKVDLSCEEMRNDQLISLGLGGARVKSRTSVDGVRRVRRLHHSIPRPASAGFISSSLPSL
jgi:hypothetical protein